LPDFGAVNPRPGPATVDKTPRQTYY
jgi:hypothetical protein